jgi:hypothetical protein
MGERGGSKEPDPSGFTLVARQFEVSMQKVIAAVTTSSNAMQRYLDELRREREVDESDQPGPHVE